MESSLVAEDFTLEQERRHGNIDQNSNTLLIGRKTFLYRDNV